MAARTITWSNHSNWRSSSVYAATWMRVREANQRYHDRYPGDLDRLRVLLRRRANLGNPDGVIGQLRVGLGARRAWIDDKPLELTAREFSLLEALFVRQGHVVSRTQLTEALCDWEQDLTDNGLDISVHRLRRKLVDSGARVRTIRGLGYLLEESRSADN